MEPLEQYPGVVHVEILPSACHPVKGRRIERIIEEKNLNGALIASCTCCHLDFACESCTDQRVRLKHRLFRESGYDPMDMVLVNIKETCLLPFKEHPDRGVEIALRVIRAGIRQLGQQRTRPEKGEGVFHQAIVLGGTEAGVAAAKGLKMRYPSVVVVDDGPVDPAVRDELRACDLAFFPGRPVRLDGRKGAFTLIVEASGGKGSRGETRGGHPEKRAGLLKWAPEDFHASSGYHLIEGQAVILGRNEYRKLPYKRDGFVRHIYSRPRGAFGSLDTGIPGVYMASWSQVRALSGEALGKSAAVAAMEESVGESPAYPFHFSAEVDAEFCRGCGRCADICPEGAAHLEEGPRGVACSLIEPMLCTGCGLCLAECPSGAIRLSDSDESDFERVMDAYLG